MSPEAEILFDVVTPLGFRVRVTRERWELTVKRWTCAVVKRTNDQGFLITSYPTDAIKEGARIWPK